MKRKLKRTFTSFVAVVILVTTLLSGAMFTAGADNPRVLFNLYLKPDLSDIKGNIQTYSVCFRTSSDPAHDTYWSLANFGLVCMDTGERFGGGYCGFQMRNNDKGQDVPAVILSMFKSNDDTYPKCRYSMGKSNWIPSDVDSEPSCNNINEEFAWKGNRWYRMVLHCWQDNDTKTTMLGMWVQDVACNNWTLIGYYDTLRSNVAMTAAPDDMHFFMEDMNPYEKKVETYQLGGIYAKDTADGKWKAITSAVQNYWGYEQYIKGGVKLGVECSGNDLGNNYFWGVADVNSSVRPKNDVTNKINAANINANGVPNFTVGIQNGTFECKKDSKNTSNLNIKWSQTASGGPQLYYKLRVFDSKGNIVKTVLQMKPDVTDCVVQDCKDTDYRCILETTDIFGHYTSKTYYSSKCPKAINVAKKPLKTVYKVGEKLDTRGLAINVTYGNGSKERITSGFKVHSLDSKTTGTKSILVTYRDYLLTSFTVTVK